MNNNETQGGLHKSVINWYPGHMAKTRRLIKEKYELIDIVYEVVDARIPISSQNPDISKIVNGKKKIVILNKCDLSDDYQNKLWVKYFQEKGKNDIKKK